VTSPRWRTASLVLLLAMASPCAFAGAPPAGVRAPDWHELSARQQRGLSLFAGRWDRMPASRRVLILERYERWNRLPPERQAQLRAGERNFERMSPAQRARMRRAFRAVRALPPGQQQRLRVIWRRMDPEQRRDWLERGGPGVAPP
jgi:hypothetical protein